MGISLTGKILRTTDGSVDTLNDILKESHRTVFTADDGLPVPLVDIEGVEVIQFLVGPDGVHIGIDAITGLYLILCQRQALPLGQRVDHFGLGIAQILDREGNGPLHTVQIIVDSQSFENEQGCRDATQTEFCGEVLLKEVLNKFDTLLCLFGIEQGLIMQGFDYLSHFYS